MIRINDRPLLPIAMLSLLVVAGPARAQGPISVDSPDTQTERLAPRTLERAPERATADGEPEIRPFGFNLFSGAFRREREDGLNPDYVISPGDRITAKIWGAMAFSETLVVDTQGNIFIPDIGPIRVKGVRNDQLASTVERAVRTVFTQNVSVYTNLEGTQPVVAFVTGFVRNPGSYAGVASDSVLYFIDRAGGIDLDRGSFRRISVTRNGKELGSVDLYEFLLHGRMPTFQFRDGDTIVVGPRLHTVTVEGKVRNSFEFEILGEEIVGADLVELARPLPDASHAALTGVRSAGPVSAYVALADLAGYDLRPGDRVVVEADQRRDSMLVRIEGSHLGPSRLAVPTDAHLIDLLHHIEVDPALADVSAVSLRRQSVAKRQKKAIEDSLRRLQTAVLGATSQTDDEAKIRVEEARLISEFVARAREVEPEGVLVVARGGVVENVLLQPDDVIAIPEKTNVVLVSGEVLVPQAVLYDPGSDISDYIVRVGGYSDRADESKFLVIRRTAEVVQGRDLAVQPGDEIVVLPEVPVKNLEFAKSIVQIIYQLAVSTAVALNL